MKTLNPAMAISSVVFFCEVVIRRKSSFDNGFGEYAMSEEK